jgi:hypothetical protein
MDGAELKQHGVGKEPEIVKLYETMPEFREPEPGKRA